MTTGTISRRQRARFYMYRNKKLQKMFIKNPDTLQKSRQFALRFYL